MTRTILAITAGVLTILAIQITVGILASNHATDEAKGVVIAAQREADQAILRSQRRVCRAANASTRSNIRALLSELRDDFPPHEFSTRMEASARVNCLRRYPPLPAITGDGDA